LRLWVVRLAVTMAAEAGPLLLRPGKRVRLQGLLAAPELNGVVGRLRAFYEDRGRWAVALPGSAAPRLLKPSNLEPLEGGILDTANILVDVLADEIVLRMFSFLPGRALLDVGLACGLLNERAQGSAALWRSLCLALLGEALVLLHEEAWGGARVGDASAASFWRSLFRAGYEGRRFQYASGIRDRFPNLDAGALVDEPVGPAPPQSAQPAAEAPSGPCTAVPIAVSDRDRFARALSASGHTASALGHHVFVIGGWRPHSKEEGLHVCAVDLQGMRLVEPMLTPDSARPCRRLRHSSCVVRHAAFDGAGGQDAVLVLGGCHDQTHEPCPGLHCLLFLQLMRPDGAEIRWQQADATGEAPRAVWHHSAGAFAQGRRVVVFGGDLPQQDPEFVRIGDRAYASHVYVLDVEERLWQRVATRGQVPSWRSLHTGVAYTSLSDGSERFVVMGGCEEHLKVFSGGRPASMEGYSLNLETFKWECGSALAKRKPNRPRGGRFVPKARMRFAAERYGCHLLVYGGHGMETMSDEEQFLTLNLMSLEWQCAAVRNEPKAFPYAPAAVLAGGCLVGGVTMTARGVCPVPKLDVVCLCPPESLD